MQRFASALAFSGTAVVATLAAALMAGSARAETPTIETHPFVSTRARADVQAELMGARAAVANAASEWALQQNDPVSIHSGLTRAQVRAEYIAAREAVHAMGSEDGGSSLMAKAPLRRPTTVLANVTTE